MALKMTSDSQLLFFKSLFGAHDPAVSWAQYLLAKGVKFEVGFFNVVAIHSDGSKASVQLSANSTAIIKGTIPPAILGHNSTVVSKWLESMYLTVNPHATVLEEIVIKEESKNVPVQSDPLFTVEPSKYVYLMDKGTNIINTIKVLRTFLHIGLKDAKDAVDAVSNGPVLVLSITELANANDFVIALQNVGATVQVKHTKIPGTAQVMSYGFTAAAMKMSSGGYVQVSGHAQEDITAIKYKASPKPVNKVIKLREAKALGQKVRGTGNSSVYYTIAMNPRVKVAAKIGKSGSVSFRVEADNPTHAEMASIAEAVDWKGDYGSKHLTIGELPIGRVVGAFLGGFGIKFQEQVTYAGELVVDENA